MIGFTLRQQRDPIEPLPVGVNGIACSRGGIRRGDGTAGICPVGLRQVGCELQLIRAAAQRKPAQRERAAGLGGRVIFGESAPGTVRRKMVPLLPGPPDSVVP